MLWPGDTRLHVRASTEALWNDGLDSLANIPYKRWTHIAVSYSQELLQLYINGMLDTQTILKGGIKVRNIFFSQNFFSSQEELSLNLLDK